MRTALLPAWLACVCLCSENFTARRGQEIASQNTKHGVERKGKAIWTRDNIYEDRRTKKSLSMG
jgi:hypothetical protein